jgi:hypothetical protein
MKRFSLAAVALIALTVTATAGDTVMVKCAGFKSVPPETIDRNPVVATSVTVHWKLRDDQPDFFAVQHDTLSGESFVRDKQYRDLRMWSARSGDYWSGVSITNPRRTMVGQLAFDDSRGIDARHYIEKTFVSGRLERTTTSTCISGN